MRVAIGTMLAVVGFGLAAAGIGLAHDVNDEREIQRTVALYTVWLVQHEAVIRGELARVACGGYEAGERVGAIVGRQFVTDAFGDGHPPGRVAVAMHGVMGAVVMWASQAERDARCL
jgi:hypothetical protein